MRLFFWRKPLPAAAVLLCLVTSFVAAQTEERIDTGRFGAEEPEPSGAEDAVDEETGFVNKWLYLGLRAGPSLRFYTPPGVPSYTGRDTLGFALDLAFQASLPVLPFLNVQAEAVITWDNASVFKWRQAYSGGESIVERYSREYDSFSLQFPLMARFNLYPGKFRISPFLGMYFFLPLGKLTETSSLNSIDESFLSYRYSLPLGILGGLNGAMKLGPGMILADLRYTIDLGEPEPPEGAVYRRSMLSLTLGYEWGFFTRNGGNHE
ncbi:MAG: hypothetical protein LBQ35_07255 [Spirochaetaceae bacterium]|jgi:hypothetical protein|nr:hypothetical protein [Spirochaetaceae bacterium]